MYMCFVNLEKSFNRIPRKFWSGGILEFFLTSEMSLGPTFRKNNVMVSEGIAKSKCLIIMFIHVKCAT